MNVVLPNAGLESSTVGPVYQNIEDFTKCSYEDLCNNKRASLYEVPVSLKKQKLQLELPSPHAGATLYEVPVSQKKESQAKLLQLKKDVVEIENESIPTQDMYHDSSSEDRAKTDSKTQLLQLEIELIEVEKNNND